MLNYNINQLKLKIMKSKKNLNKKEIKKLFVVKYNDCYGNGNTNFEIIVESKKDFLQWLKEHNEERKMDYLNDDDFCEEKEEEFDLIPLNLYNNK